MRTFLVFAFALAIISSTNADISTPVSLEENFPQYLTLQESERQGMIQPVVDWQVRVLEQIHASTEEFNPRAYVIELSTAVGYHVSKRNLATELLSETSDTKLEKALLAFDDQSMRTPGCLRGRARLAEEVKSRAGLSALWTRAEYQRVSSVLLDARSYEQIEALRNELTQTLQRDEWSARTESLRRGLNGDVDADSCAELRRIMDYYQGMKGRDALSYFVASKVYDQIESTGVGQFASGLDESAREPFIQLAARLAYFRLNGELLDEVDALAGPESGVSVATSDEVAYWHGQYYMHEGQLASARAAFALASASNSLDDRNAQARMAEAEVLIVARDYDAARTRLEDMLVAFAEDPHWRATAQKKLDHLSKISGSSSVARSNTPATGASR